MKINKGPLYQILWAKSEPYKPLLSHMVETGYVAGELLQHSIFKSDLYSLCQWLDATEQEVISFTEYICALHDIGKCHPSFQGLHMELLSKLDAVEIKKLQLDNDLFRMGQVPFRHEKYSNVIYRRIGKKNDRFEKGTVRWISSLIGLHHQGKFGEKKDWVTDDWIEAASQLEEYVYRIFAPPRIQLGERCDVSAAGAVVLGIMIMSDWIASGPLFAEKDASQEEIAARMKEFIHNAGLEIGRLPVCQTFSDLWPWIPKDGRRPLQQKIEKVFQKGRKPLAVIIEAPMGEGKTEAGVYAAIHLANLWHKSGFYLGLPTSATSNQMVMRMDELLAAHHIDKARLLHAMAWMMDDGADDGAIHTGDEMYARAWTRPAKRGLLVPYAVGTVDQAMMAALDVRYGVLRLVGLSTKVLIIDEIHAYDAFMYDIIIKLLKWCKAMRIPVVMLSATLPAAKKEELMAVYGSAAPPADCYPVITLIGEENACIPIENTFMKKRFMVRLEPLLNNPDAIAALAVEKVREGGCLCIIMNTVRTARQVFQALKRYDMAIYLFTARTTAEKRQEIEGLCMELFGKDKSHRPQRAILVGTEVLEQSLDLDFDYMITAIAPIDLILQRMGREHRHEDTLRPAGLRQPEITVLVPDTDQDYDVNAFVYPEILLELTQRELEAHQTIGVPEDLAVMVDNVYSNEEIPERYFDTWWDNELNKQLMRNQARQYELRSPNPAKFCLKYGNQDMSDEAVENARAAKTRFGEETVQIALIDKELFLKLKQAHTVDKATAKKALMKSLSVYATKIGDYLGKQTIYGKSYEGSGLLKFVWLFPMVENRCVFDDGSYLELDPILGFMINGEE